MPGKVSPAQREAMVVVCIQVLAEGGAIAFAGSQGNCELDAMGPIVINDFLYSATILADACEKLRRCYLEGTTFHREQIDQYVNRSLMLVTALSPVIGYDKVSTIGLTTKAADCEKPHWAPATSTLMASARLSTPARRSARSSAKL
jgi:fumarate hydratase class II